MAYLENLLPEFRKGVKIRCKKWSYGEYIYLGKRNIVYNERNKRYEFVNNDLFVEWELYQETVNWDYIIKNKCLCWFWDDGEEKRKRAGTLADHDSCNNKFARCRYNNIATIWFDNCRPVRRDEVTFYEDRKDEI